MRRIFSALPLLCLLTASSCIGPKKTIYFLTDERSDSAVLRQAIQPRPEITIHSNDILAINVSSITSLPKANPAAAVAIYNEGGSQQGPGYLVDEDGYIDFPVLGRLKMAGLTIREAKTALANRLKDAIIDPVIEMRITNYKITLMGQVGRIGPVTTANYKINVVEALAQAGDIPINGRKDNVLVIRENNGVREYGRLNLNSKEVFNSPYFYLQQNDIVYVEPNRLVRQGTNEFFNFYLPAISAVVNTGFAVYGIVQLTRNR